MIAVRVRAEGPVTSFRYPFFVQNVQPSLPLPPLATLYGHICSAAGRLLDPALLRIGYSFTCRGTFKDYEHLWFEGGEFKMNPFVRDLLFEPRLLLYVVYPQIEWLAERFRSPYYPVVLGRSQDLMAYTAVDVVELVEAPAVYFEGTLLPSGFGSAVEGHTYPLTLAAMVDERRQPRWASFTVVEGRVRYPAEAGRPTDGLLAGILADPEIRGYPRRPDLPLGVWLHSLREA
jgi:CRISPR-associated protein Cas5t